MAVWVYFEGNEVKYRAESVVVIGSSQCAEQTEVVGTCGT